MLATRKELRMSPCGPRRTTSRIGSPSQELRAPSLKTLTKKNPQPRLTWDGDALPSRKCVPNPGRFKTKYENDKVNQAHGINTFAINLRAAYIWYCNV